MNRQGEALTLFPKKSAFFCKVYMYRSDHLKDVGGKERVVIAFSNFLSFPRNSFSSPENFQEKQR